MNEAMVYAKAVGPDQGALARHVVGKVVRRCCRATGKRWWNSVQNVCTVSAPHGASLNLVRLVYAVYMLERDTLPGKISRIQMIMLDQKARTSACHLQLEN